MVLPGREPRPHHAPQDYIDRYRGQFDDGYEAYREWVLPRMVERRILPEGTELTPINPMTPGTFSEGDAVRPWDTLSDDEKRLFSRVAEVYAGSASTPTPRWAGSSTTWRNPGSSRTP